MWGHTFQSWGVMGSHCPQVCGLWLSVSVWTVLLLHGTTHLPSQQPVSDARVCCLPRPHCSLVLGELRGGLLREEAEFPLTSPLPFLSLTLSLWLWMLSCQLFTVCMVLHGSGSICGSGGRSCHSLYFMTSPCIVDPVSVMPESWMVSIWVENVPVFVTLSLKDCLINLLIL